MSDGKTLIDDADTQVNYSTSPGWEKGIWPGQNPQPRYGTNHGTPNPGETATLTFEGVAIRVYGFKSGNHGYRNITIDDGPTVLCDGREGEQGGQALVYSAEGLSPGTHTIKFEHTGEQGQYLNLDYFEVTPNGASTSPPTNTPPDSNIVSSSTSSKSQINIAAITGGVAGAAVVALLLAVAYIFHLRRKKSKNGREEEEEEKVHPTVTPWVQEIASPPPREIAIPSFEMRKPTYPADTRFHESTDRLMGSPPPSSGYSRMTAGSHNTSQGYDSTGRATSSPGSSSMHASSSGHAALTSPYPSSRKSQQMLRSGRPSSEQQNIVLTSGGHSRSRSSENPASSENAQLLSAPMTSDDGTVHTPTDNPPPYISLI
ncbi:hypothetical protein CPB86DRAFT_778984 [Serendipita vermifera]|nr:hypothetical protein CPB86DRAFT_778984 [Serendipita vermifera]